MLRCFALSRHGSTSLIKRVIPHVNKEKNVLRVTSQLTLPSFGLFFVCKGSESSVHVCPRPCSSTDRWAKLSTHRHNKDNPHRSPCSHAPVAMLPPHVCHRQRDCAVSVHSHMQQDMGTQVLPNLGAPAVHVGDLEKTKLGDSFHRWRRVIMRSTPHRIHCDVKCCLQVNSVSAFELAVQESQEIFKEIVSTREQFTMC